MFFSSNTNSKNLLFNPNSMNTVNRQQRMTAYVMNKVGNVNLWRYVKTNHRINNSNKRKIRDDILKAIEFMHKQGISHGDLHSGNVLVELDNSGHMKKLWVIDFGRYVNIPIGSNEKQVYNKLRKNRWHQNYNLFNSTRKPVVMLYNGPTGAARANYNLAREMYGIRTLKKV